MKIGLGLSYSSSNRCGALPNKIGVIDFELRTKEVIFKEKEKGMGRGNVRKEEEKKRQGRGEEGEDQELG